MIEFFSAWYNWPFLLSLLVGIGLSLASLVGGHGDDAGGGHALAGDGGHDLGGHDLGGHGFGHDVPELGASGAGGLLPSSGASHGAPHAEGESSWLGWLGVGKAPLGLLLQLLLLGFGLSGMLCNAVARDLGVEPGGWAFPFAVLFSVLIALGASRLVGKVLGRFAPDSARHTAGDFVGTIGVTVSSVTHHIGQVKVSLHQRPTALLNVCLHDPAIPDLPRGMEVQLLHYDPTRRLYHVAPLPPEALSPQTKD